MYRRRFLAGVLVTPLLLAACGSPAPTSDSPSATIAPAPGVTRPPATAPAVLTSTATAVPAVASPGLTPKTLEVRTAALLLG